MKSSLSPTRLFTHSPPGNEEGLFQFRAVSLHESPSRRSPSSSSSPSSSPFSSPSKASTKSRIPSSPYRAPEDSDEDDERSRGNDNKENVNTNNWTATSPSELPYKSPNRFAAPEFDDDESEEEDHYNPGELDDFTESSLNMHGSFLSPAENYQDFGATLPYRPYDHPPTTYNDNTDDISNNTLTPYPFSWNTYNSYLRSPLRDPLRSPSAWDDEEENQGNKVGFSPSRLVSPDLRYLLDDLTIGTKHAAAPAKAVQPPPPKLALYLALSNAVKKETESELAVAEDEYAAEVEMSKLKLKSEAIHNEAKLKQEEQRKEETYQKALAAISNDQALFREIRERKERERLEEIRKKEEEERRARENLEKQRREEEIRKKKEEDERKKREEEERKRREELERAKAEEKRKEEERERKRQEEEAARKRLDDEKKERERKRLEEEIAKQKEEEERAKKAAEDQASVQEPSVASPPPDTPPPLSPSPATPSPSNSPALQSQTETDKQKKKELKKYISPQALEESRALSRNMKGVLQAVLTLERNPEFAALKRKITMDTNVKIGQLCPDVNVVKARTAELSQLFQDVASKSDAVFLFCLHLLSSKIMRQTALVEKPQSVFPLGFMAVPLMQRHPTLVNILIGKFYEYCPYTIPRYPKRRPEQSEFEFKKSIGYLQIEDSPPKLEEEAAYFSRMEGAVRLYATIIQTPSNGQHPYGAVNGWKWLARIANLPPIEITATILRVFLEIAGHELLKVYKLQFHKLLVYFRNEFVPQCPSAARPSDHDRLVKYLDAYMRTGQLNPPAGRNLE